MNISVIVPVYKGGPTLCELVQRLYCVLESSVDTYELILINDCSPDDSWEVICELSEEHDWIKGINLMRNYGQHNALLCGIREARYEVIVTMDDDLQNPPEEIPKLLSKIEEGYDVVYGTPLKDNHNVWRNLTSKITKIALKSALDVKIARHVSAFRAFRTSIRNAFDEYRTPYVSIDVLLSWGTTLFAAVPVHHDQRKSEQSTYTIGKLTAHAFNMLTGFSTLPLQFASMLGFIVTAFGLCVLAYVIGVYLIRGGSVPGFSFLASIIAIFSGAQLLALGIIGEYLARMHFRTIDRPPYVIREDSKRNEIEHHRPHREASHYSKTRGIL